MREDTKPIWDILLIILLGSIIFGALVWVRDFGTPDLPRYAQMGREMLQNHNFITPYFNGVKDLSEPPLYHWIQAALISVFGFSTSLLRLVSVIAAIFGCIYTYIAARMAYGRRCALISTAILSANLLYFTYAQTIAPFMLGSVLLSCALLSFLISFDTKEGLQTSLIYIAFWVFTGLATLCLGIKALIIPLFAIGITMGLLHYWEFLKQFLNPIGLLLYFLITVPWFILAQKYNPGFLHFFFIENMKISFQDKLLYEHALLSIPLFLLAFLPWTIFIVHGIWANCPRTWFERYNHLRAFYLIIWAMVVLVYILLPGRQFVWILTLFPAISILIGRYLHLIWDHPPIVITKMDYEIFFLVALTGISLLVGVSYFGLFSYDPASYPYIRLLTFTVLAIILISIPVLRYLKFSYGFMTLFIGTIICLNALVYTYQHISHNHVNTLAEFIKPNLNKDDVLVSYGKFYDELPLLFNQPIVAVNWQDRPQYGKSYQNTSSWVVEDKTFWPFWHKEDKRFYMFLSKQEYAKLLENKTSNLYYIASTPYTVLISNQPA